MKKMYKTVYLLFYVCFFPFFAIIESDESPGIYLREDFLGGPTELRASTAERAALFFDEALSLVNRTSNGQYEPAFIFTLHVYQYSLAGKGGVAGGRSRLHLIDLGGCANRLGGLPLSGVGNVLLSILSGQRHPPNRDHPLTPLLKDCLAPLTCHVSIVAHILHDQSHADALTTIQLASRIHRMRRRKHRYPVATDKNLLANGTGKVLRKSF
jgi:kinesin family member 26